ncbi:MAG: hypothetical protein P9X22_09380 [Candidatus Zapsychrus exili]|nr:hypothetical protein [Candidatus Zapsychrus exili]
MINNVDAGYMNRFLHLGEVLMLGSIVLAGEMLLLSLLKLYTAQFLWSVVFLNYFVLINRDVRLKVKELFSLNISWDIPLFGFIFLIGFFMFRNCYFLSDGDSHSTYLLAQKLWLENKTSIFGNASMDIKIFVPHFNAVFYGLGLSVFPKETLFPQLIVAFWTVVVSILVFGYTSYRFNRWYAISAVMFVLFNDHIYYSGANNCVIINSALIALFFSVSYNFLESRTTGGSFRFLLALIFLTQFMANKYQVFYVTVSMFIVGILIQKQLLSNVRSILFDKKKLVTLVIAAIIMLLWYIKNQLAVGLATFPILADKFDILNWNSEMVNIFGKVYLGSIAPDKFLKYMNYMFIWPGIKVSKIVIVTISLLPLFIMFSISRNRVRVKSVFELCYWLFVSIIVVAGTCIVSYVDPRHYRYGIAILAFTSVLSIDYIFQKVIGLRNTFFIGIVIFVLSVANYRIMFDQGGAFKRPLIEENVGVILDKVHFEDVEEKYFPYNTIVMKSLKKNKDKFLKGAWDVGEGGMQKLSAFLLPTRPQVGLWSTTLVKWDSYEDEKLIVKDLSDAGLEWVMRVENKELKYFNLDEYAKKAVKEERFPKKVFFNYNFPEELTEVNY